MTHAPPPAWTDVAATLRDLASRSPENDALLWDGGRLPIGDLVDRVDRAMGLLMHEGWAPGMVTGVAIRDIELHLAVTLALLSLGAPSVTLPSHETEASLRATLTRLDVALILHDEPRSWMEGRRAVEITAGAIAASGRGMGHAAGSPGENPALFIKTSGSTNAPKIFAMSFARIARAAVVSGAEPRERCVMRNSTMEFDSSRAYRVYALLGGNTSVLPPADRTEIGRVCAEHAVTQVHAGTYLLETILGSRKELPRLPDATELMIGGSRVPGAMRAEIARRLSRNLLISYATSEIGVISVARPEEHEAFPEGVGHPRPEAQVEIVDEEDRPVEPGVVGEIRARRPANPTRYVGQAPAAESSQFRDGWFYPRDLISRGEGEPMVFHGRADDVMLLAGVKISGAAIEDALSALPAVGEVVAYGLKSRLHGEIPAAAVVLAPGAEASPAQLLAHCRAALGLRAPRHIKLVEAIPRTPTGKPLKRALAEL